MLINESYFTGGPYYIAQLGQPSVVAALESIIERWEADVMEAALGYDFYQAFLQGINVDSDDQIEQRWMDLLNGVAFANQSQIKRLWAGFAGGVNTKTVIAAQRDDLFIYAGTTPGFPANGYQYTNADLAGWNFTLEVFGEGTWEPGEEWDYKPGGGISLVNTGYTTTPGERWVLHFTGKKIQVVTAGATSNKRSPLAGFIYYEYMRDLINQNTGIGTVQNQGENSTLSSPAQKMVDAYNAACDQMGILYDLLWTDRAKPTPVYPEFDYRQVDGNGYFGWFDGGFENWWWGYSQGGYSFKKINTFGI